MKFNKKDNIIKNKKPLRVLLSQQYARRKNDYEKIKIRNFNRKTGASQRLDLL